MSKRQEIADRIIEKQDALILALQEENEKLKEIIRLQEGLIELHKLEPKLENHFKV